MRLAKDSGRIGDQAPRCEVLDSVAATRFRIRVRFSTTSGSVSMMSSRFSRLASCGDRIHVPGLDLFGTIPRRSFLHVADLGSGYPEALIKITNQ
jgi:hypothetical protein